MSPRSPSRQSADRRRPGEPPERGDVRLWHIGTALTVSFAAALICLVALSWVAWLWLAAAGYRKHGPPALHDTLGVLQLVFASVAGAGALVALVVSYRRQKVAEADSAHDRTRVFNERFTAAAAQLGDDKPAVRLAGIHAMAGLADDWTSNRQTCVDVLCAYLRMPYEPDPGREASAQQRLAFQANREIRHTVIRVISSHLQESAIVSWRDQNLDFTSIEFDGGSFEGAQFTGATVNFQGAQFTSGTVNFKDTQFCGALVNFDGAQFTGGTVRFDGSRVSGGTVSFQNAQFNGGLVEFEGAQFTGGTTEFTHAEFSGGVSFHNVIFGGGTVAFKGARFTSRQINFSSAQFTGGTVNFHAARFDSGLVSFNFARFCGTVVDFNSAVFANGIATFNGAQFVAGILDFTNAAANRSELPKFDGTPPQTIVKLRGAGQRTPA